VILLICAGDSITLNAGNPGFSYNWSTTDTTQAITVDTTGTYWVMVSDSSGPDNCVGIDSITVTVIDSIVAVAGPNTSICEGDSIEVVIQDLSSCTDADDDGYCEENDCDDTNSSINPGEFEICTDNIDNDCDDLIDMDDLECIPSTGNEILAGQSEDLEQILLP